MSLKFYTDTHIPKQVAIQLRERGIEVVRCEEVGMAEAEDKDHLAYAVEHGLSVITKDDDFAKLDDQWKKENRKHTSIFYSSRTDISAIGIIIKYCVEIVELVNGGAATIEDDIENQVLYIT
ncbi:MAG: DUF5615 family PIN-like protein [Aggregatilineales bacterium]